MMDVDRFAVSLAKAEDVPQCILIDKERGFEVDESVHQKASKEDRQLVAKIDAKVVGYLRFGSFWDEEIAYIQMIRVAQAYRRKGVGRKLVGALEGILRKQKIAWLLSSTEETNLNSRSFHRALQFEECGRLDINEDGTPEIFLKKRLRSG